MKIQWKKLILSILLPVAVGGISGWISSGAMDDFEKLNKPALTPPGAVFPVIWTILFILMGISFYLVWVSDAPKEEKQSAYKIYGLQLAVNFFWSILFFNLNAYLLSFLWLILLWVLIVAMIKAFSNISVLAGRLQIPYLLWVTFAGYLNLMIFIMNR